MFKIMIIDDNHSFIDSLKVMMKEFSFTYDEFQRFLPAETKLEKNGAALHSQHKSKLEKFAQQVLNDKPEKDGKVNSKEVLNSIAEKMTNDVFKDKIKNPINRESGYFLIFVEQNTETNLKGLSFIENQLAQGHGLQPENFVLLSESTNGLEARASQLKIPLMVKPIKAPLLKNFLIEKINSYKEKEARLNGLFTVYSQLLEQHQHKSHQKSKKVSAKVTGSKTKPQTENDFKAVENPAEKEKKDKTVKKSTGVKKELPSTSAQTTQKIATKGTPQTTPKEILKSTDKKSRVAKTSPQGASAKDAPPKKKTTGKAVAKSEKSKQTKKSPPAKPSKKSSKKSSKK